MKVKIRLISQSVRCKRERVKIRLSIAYKLPQYTLYIRKICYKPTRIVHPKTSF